MRARHAVKVPAGHSKRGERVLSVKAVVRPEPDVAKLARALAELARVEAKRKLDPSTDDASPLQDVPNDTRTPTDHPGNLDLTHT